MTSTSSLKHETNSKTVSLIADIGGTNARFALCHNHAPYFRQEKTLLCADFNTIEDAIDHYLNSQHIGADKTQQLTQICFAVAGPIRNEKMRFPNNHWHIDCAQLRHRYGIDNVQLLNDFEAIAYSLLTLEEADIMPIGKTWQYSTQGNVNFGIVGPGSGLGMAGLCQRDGHILPLVAEGGHTGFAPENSLQVEILSYLHRKLDGRVSCERLLSGPGLVNIYNALCAIHGQESSNLTAADISNAGSNHSDPICQQSMDLFFEILGQVAGDIALTLGATDGIFIGGGIMQRYPQQLANSKFRQGFENKGRHSHLLENTATWLITHKNPGLLGASFFSRTLA